MDTRSELLHTVARPPTTPPKPNVPTYRVASPIGTTKSDTLLSNVLAMADSVSKRATGLKTRPMAPQPFTPPVPLTEAKDTPRCKKDPFPCQ